ncbi:integrase [Dokdonella fugitiva]|uniref:Integrase n=1 Tax=Dokdonella fugitiva TaxID=328517 RepID=A0A839EP78_9GAMM|nr:site-specific integrase [Dokdonella fugitiva]MBA8886097.1 integrase [Dokdonella fugitiva]
MRQLQRLSARTVATATQPGYLSDGGGLYLQVTATGSRSWVLRFTLRGRAREMGLGSATMVGLAEARARAAECRRQLAEGIDPIDARVRVRAQNAHTFETVATEFIEANAGGWRSAKHAEQWRQSLGTYAFPVLGRMPVEAIDLAHVLRVLEPIWTTKTETATRVRQRIEAVLDYAGVKRYIAPGNENPARWRGHLQRILPKPSRVSRVQHMAALHYTALPAFMAALRAISGPAALALRFTILTCARTGEARRATMGELDLADARWTVPAARMKAGREHVVPLSAAAIDVVRETGVTEGPLFSYRRAAISNNAMLMLLRRMGRDDVTVHGFRSTFKDWATEQTDFPADAIEIALAHTVGDKTEQAYRRGNLLAKRRALAEAWAAHCCSVTPLELPVASSTPPPRAPASGTYSRSSRGRGTRPVRSGGKASTG